MSYRRFIIMTVIALAVGGGACGCSGSWQLMPTPNLYAQSEKNPFANVPAELQSNQVDVLYLTDRLPKKESSVDNDQYGFERSRAGAFGVSWVQLGKVVWSAYLVEGSRHRERPVKLPVSIVRTEELGRFPP